MTALLPDWSLPDAPILIVSDFRVTCALRDVVHLHILYRGDNTFQPVPGSSGFVGPNFSVTAEAAAPIPFDVIPVPDVSAYVGATAVISGPPAIEISATAIASQDATYSTSGTLRPGFIHFDIGLGNSHADYLQTNEAVLADGVHRYENGAGAQFSRCGIGGCTFIGTVPFNLGSEFQVSASVSLEERASGTGPEGRHGERDSLIAFSLLEADGTTPVPFSITPEPSTYGLLLLGLGAVVLGLSGIRSRYGNM